jgi:uncharacterized Zn finger protein
MSFETYGKRRSVEGGIKARSTRGAFAEGWWARLWLHALERMGWDTRLQRGRTYARAGQVVDYKIEPGKITARVQGSRPKPYDVAIELQKFDDATWKRALDTIAESAIFSVQLLNQTMPDNIDEAFQQGLLPRIQGDLKTECSCPDFANPCKHIAAVCYIVAEALDHDPFLIFALRGRARQDVLQELRERRGATEASEPEKAAAEPENIAEWWTARPLPARFDVGLEPPQVPHAVLRRLGSPGSWAKDADFMAALCPAWDVISQAALDTALD